MSIVAAAPASAQTSFAGARAAGLTGDPPASTGDPWAESNPASWSDAGAHALVLHAARLYGLAELSVGSVQALAAVRSASFAIGARSFGFEDYRETVFTAGLALPILSGTHRAFHVGIRVRRHQVAIRRYGAASATALSSGFIFPIFAGVHMGMAAENLVVLRSVISEDLPRRLHAGLSFVGSDFLHVHADVVKDSRSPLISRISFEARPLPAVTLRSGFSLEPPRFAGGLGLKLAIVSLDFAAERHIVLGWSPSFSVGLLW